jgi:TrmH family RNA methyltransferase
LSSLIKITSPTNQSIKELVRLKDRKSERAKALFVVEGRREIERALACEFQIEEMYYCPQLVDEASRTLLAQLNATKMAELSEQAFSKVATRDGSDGLLAVFASRHHDAASIRQRAKTEDLFLIAMENVEKPGNLGAVLRTADALGVHGIILLGRSVDVWNPNVIRSSLGGIFSVPVVQWSDREFFGFCQSNNVKVVAASLVEESSDVFSLNLSGSVAILLGSEAYGLSQKLLAGAPWKVVIPMEGVCDSLNVSVAAGILAFEVKRQRRHRL